MIFVTVGTHEQQFNRLVKGMDELILDNVIMEKVFIQKGYSNYDPEFCESKGLMDYDEMINKTKEASIVITHGGPGSIMLALSMGKIPIVFPRNPEYEEHVDNHQILFTKRLEEEKKIIAVYKKEDLKEVILNYAAKVKELKQFTTNNNKEKFVEKLEDIVGQLINK
ncbi:glycosyltransferase [Bacillus toyonensis]|uniref:glycosyltransferase n=1 Tax=Bacillus toyonensis TaxID=155322 RepID=UPI000BEDD30C|nr:glycosyltransferase [Bacillus toyonensis]PED96591.1 glycosyl transferase family 28 [Bacillus toyonensis]PEK46817.1 glycosyl transferase family 28 [Bacillus toyonensis]PEL61734.1 glycosyl transferase family 28 [Bacillus toyonensis]PFZ40383.1 glycosyl transferase family 28 [Bacillus toyonensis]UKS60209.1 multidrug MFS transporter [Bacillus toyonensis]